jgi:mycothiol synthase
VKKHKTATDEVEFQIRPATEADLSAVFSLAATYGTSVVGEADVDESDFADTWNNPKTRLATDVWVALNSAGDMIAYEHSVNPAGNGRLEIEGFVHPDYQNLGIGSALIERALRRAQELSAELPMDVRHFIRAGTYTNDRAACTLMENSGFTHVRYFLRMTIELEDQPARAAAPDGIRIRSVAPDESLEPIHAACDEIFRDHWGSTPISLDEWITLRTGGSLFDRSLWFVAYAESGELAGVSLCTNLPDMGWVDTLGVRRTYRNRGVGKSLLQHSFTEFHRRDQRRVGLGVDADSLTDATKLYESAGMQSDVYVDVWELGLE